MENIIIGGAWPYANGSLHIGHIAALIPGDVLARYFRAKGNRVFYVSGSDCHGTPITIRAKQEDSTPDVISEYYHKEFCEVFEKLGFSYDLYTKTSDSKHKEYVSAFHKQLYNSDYIEEKTVKQAFCPTCQKVLTDRLVVGICPACGSATRGDQCDACGEVLDADTVIDAKCADCGTPLSFGETTQLFLQISKLKMNSVIFSMSIRIGERTLLHLQRDILMKDSETVQSHETLIGALMFLNLDIRIRKSIYGQRMSLVICQLHLFCVKKEELISKMYTEQKAVTIMYTARTIFLSTRLFYLRFC